MRNGLLTSMSLAGLLAAYFVQGAVAAPVVPPATPTPIYGSSLEQVYYILLPRWILSVPLSPSILRASSLSLRSLALLLKTANFKTNLFCRTTRSVVPRTVTLCRSAFPKTAAAETGGGDCGPRISRWCFSAGAPLYSSASLRASGIARHRGRPGDVVT